MNVLRSIRLNRQARMAATLRLGSLRDEALRVGRSPATRSPEPWKRSSMRCQCTTRSMPWASALPPADISAPEARR